MIGFDIPVHYYLTCQVCGTKTFDNRNTLQETIQSNTFKHCWQVVIINASTYIIRCPDHHDESYERKVSETCTECGNEYMHLLTDNSYYCDECGNIQ